MNDIGLNPIKVANTLFWHTKDRFGRHENNIWIIRFHTKALYQRGS